MKETRSTLLTDHTADPLPWQIELRRLSDQLAASNDRELTKDDLQREIEI